MAQHDYVISNGTGAAVRSDLNNALSAIVTQNSGSTEPTTTYAYQMWADTNAGVMKIRNGANSAWITLYQLDGEWTSIAFENGSAAAPSIYFKDSGTDTGFFSGGTDQVNIATAGTERVEWGTSEVVFNDAGNNYDFRVEGDTNANLLFVDASADAVGIGTSSPSNDLDILKTASGSTTTARIGATATSGANNATLILNNGGTGNATLRFDYEGSTNRASIGVLASDQKLTFGTAGSTAMTIDASQRLGIGSTAPSDSQSFGNALDLRGSTGAAYYSATSDNTTRAYFATFTGGGYIGTETNHPLIIRTNNAEKARLDTSGRLLVGTSSALGAGDGQYSLLQIRGNSSSSSAGGGISLSRGEAATSISTGELLGQITFTDNGGGIYSTIACEADAAAGTNDFPGRLVFSVTKDGESSPRERMRISNNGEVSFTTAGQAVTIGGGTAESIFRNASGMAGIHFSTASVVATNGSGTVTDNAITLGSAGTRWSVVYAGTGSINTSDANLKQDAEDLEQSELNVATAIKGLIKKFRFVDAVADKGNDARIHVGVIAQEVEQAFVDEGLDPRRYALFCEDTLEDGSKRLGIRYDELLAFVIAAL